MRASLIFVVAGSLLAAACASRPPKPVPAPPGGGQCLAALDRHGVAWTLATLAASTPACFVDTPVRVSDAAAQWNKPAVVACGFALKLDDFTRDTIERLARIELGSSVRAVRNFGTYSCRRTRRGRESQHAHGDAIDIAGFDLDDGTLISVERDWNNGARGRFLHEVARAACDRFSVVLTPDSDRDHFNHIHIDAGPYRLCG